MKASAFEILGAGRRRGYGMGGLRGGLGMDQRGCPPCACPPCEKTWVGWYIGSAIGGVAIVTMFVRAIAQP